MPVFVWCIWHGLQLVICGIPVQNTHHVSAQQSQRHFETEASVSKRPVRKPCLAKWLYAPGAVGPECGIDKWRIFEGLCTAAKLQGKIKGTSQERSACQVCCTRGKVGFSVWRQMKARYLHTVWVKHSERGPPPLLAFFSSPPSPPVCCDEWFWYWPCVPFFSCSVCVCVCVRVWVWVCVCDEWLCSYRTGPQGFSYC